MKKIITISIILAAHLVTLSQSGWFTQYQTSSGFTCVSFINNNTGYIGGANQITNIYKTTNGGLNWIVVYNQRAIKDLQFLNEFTGYALSDSYVLKTTNAGVNWTEFNISSSLTFDIYFLNAETGFFSGENGKVVKTTNGGNNWIDKSLNVNSQVRGVWFLNADTGIVCLYLGSVYKTTNGGSSWYQVFTNSMEALLCVQFINVSTGFIGCSRSLFLKTTNSGNNWMTINLPSANDDWEDVYFRNNGTGFLAGGTISPSVGRILKSTNFGDNWFECPIPAVGFCIGVVFPSHDTGYAVSYTSNNGSQIKTITGGVGINKISTEVPEAFSLYQNYPNPFNPVTSFKFQVPKLSGVKIIVFDILGRVINVLVNEQLKPGTYEVDWDASNYTSGVYFYKLTSDDSSTPLRMTKKMILIK